MVNLQYQKRELKYAVKRANRALWRNYCAGIESSDSIIPGDIQYGEEIILPWLLSIYNAYLRLLYIPWSWRIFGVIFIPKSGKPWDTWINDYRPISLSSFYLKALERFLSVHIRASIDPALLSTSQHAFTRDKSVQAALHSFISRLEKSMHVKEYTFSRRWKCIQ